MKKVRITAFVLSLVMMIPVFCACKSENDIPQGEAKTESVKIVDNGTQIYKLIRPDTNESSVSGLIDTYKSVLKNFSTLSGLTFEGANDWKNPNETFNADEYEILLGCTNRAESAAVYAEIGLDGFAVKRVGNKIVIAAHTSEKLTEAITYFFNNLLKTEKSESGAATLTFTGDYVNKGEVTLLFNGENLLSGYKIVYADGNKTNKASAESVAKAINALGYELAVIPDSQAETDKEIIIGKTNRAAGNTALGDGEDTIIKVSGKKLIIGSNNDGNTGIIAKQFCDAYISEYMSNVPLVTENMNLSTNSGDFIVDSAFADSPERVIGTTVRIMSFNILCELWNDKTPITSNDRGANMVRTIKYYAPDVVGLQEMSPKCHAEFNKNFGIDYKIIEDSNGIGGTDYSTLAYNTKTVKMLEHGVRIYSKGNSKELRLMTWGLFEKLDGGEKFVALSTHWDLGSNTAYLDVQCVEMAEFVVELHNKYGCPVITTGDYNLSNSWGQYKTFVNNSGFLDARYVAKVCNRNCKTTHTLKEATIKTGDGIDHIFVSKDVSVLFFNILVDKIVADASDHYPIYADIKF